MIHLKVINLSLIIQLIVGQYTNLNTISDQAIVHLFEWRWEDIAKECPFLAHNGYGAVLTSPPQAHAIIRDPSRPWWERYQPTSYKLHSRSGNSMQFIDMIVKCNNVNVSVYVDAVINHMTKANLPSDIDSAGDRYDPENFLYPSVPYNGTNFNDRSTCSSSSPTQIITKWFDKTEARNCRLQGLLDLRTQEYETRFQITKYLNDLIDVGVAGIRIQAAKHIWPQNIADVLHQTRNLQTLWFAPGSRILVMQDVIDYGQSPIKGSEYAMNGRVSMYSYGHRLFRALSGQENFSLNEFFGIGLIWGDPWLDSDHSMVFVDNYITQRYDNMVFSFKTPYKYKLAVAFMLAHPYGAPVITSSYNFTNVDDGPPSVSDTDMNTLPVNFDSNGKCIGGWVCEHRWPNVRRMAQFRKVVSGEPIVNWATQYGCTAFGRGSKGFFIVNPGTVAINGSSFMFASQLPSGQYCDIFNGDLISNACVGLTIMVDVAGTVHVPNVGGVIPTIAIHIGMKLQPTSTTSTPQPTNTYKRTVIFLKKPTTLGEFVFLRGGLDESHPRDNGTCNHDVQINDCSIPIMYHNQTPYPESLRIWSQNDTHLDWVGKESNQGVYNGRPADGTPMAWTTNDATNSNYCPLNTFGDNYWMVDLMMDCSRTNSGWFEFKGYMNGWENNVAESSCTGNASLSLPYIDGNHIGRCGFLNIFKWGDSSCLVNHF